MCITRLVLNIEVQDNTTNELSLYNHAKCLFGIPITIQSRATKFLNI